MSVDGAEEDGVDNRLEAPAAWAPDEGSESAAAGQEADETSAQAQAPAFPEPAESAPEPSAEAGDEEDPAAPAAAFDGITSDGQAGGDTPVPPLPAAAAQAGVDFRPPGQPYTDTLTFASSGSRRGFAARMTAPFATLTQKKPKAAAAQARKPSPQAAAPAMPSPAARPQPRMAPAGQSPAQQTRRAQLRLDRIEPWSVMKFSFLMSLVGWVILFIAVSLLYFALSKLGVFHSIERTVTLVTGTKTNPSGSNPSSWFSASRVLGYTMLVGAVNVVLVTALATVGAVLYNLVTMLAGGIEVTLKESD